MLPSLAQSRKDDTYIPSSGNLTQAPVAERQIVLPPENGSPDDGTNFRILRSEARFGMAVASTRP
jgi:hypothetical protein